MNGDGCRLFGCEMQLCDGNLQTTFNMWRGGMASLPHYYSNDTSPMQTFIKAGVFFQKLGSQFDKIRPIQSYFTSKL